MVFPTTCIIFLNNMVGEIKHTQNSSSTSANAYSYFSKNVVVHCYIPRPKGVTGFQSEGTYKFLHSFKFSKAETLILVHISLPFDNP